MKLHPAKSHRGVALVTTIIVVAIMATITVALLQTTGTDRVSSRAVANNFQARLFAEAGAAAGVEALANTGLDFLVNSYVERTVNSEGGTTLAPYLATHRLGANFSSVEETRLLVSCAENYSSIESVPSEQVVDINAPITSTTPNLLGLMTADGNPRVVPAGWVNVVRDPTRAADNDSQSRNYNPVIGRYAYWIDDESSKLNIQTAGNLTTPTQLRRLAGSTPNEVSPLLFLSDNGTDIAPVAEFIPERDRLVSDGSLLSVDTSKLLTGAGYLSGNWNNHRSMLTLHSAGDERGSFGLRKINLNDFVGLSTNLNNANSRNQIAADTIALGEFINRVIPEFGNRAYNGNVTDSDKRRYCIQIAANIRDYIDADSQPTAITQNNQWLQPPNPNQAGDGAPTLPPLAFGKEIVPSITEYVGYYYNLDGALRIDHSFEVLNIYSSSVNTTSLSPLTILMSERNEITPRPNSNAPDPDLPGEPGNPPLNISIPSSTSFPAGQYRILTTLPSNSPLRSEWVAPSAAFSPVTSNENSYTYGSNGLRMQGDYLASSADVTTEISIANNFGYIDFHPRIAQQGSGNNGTMSFTSSSIPAKIPTQPFANDRPSGDNSFRCFPLDSGDPRSLSDIYPSFSEPTGARSAIAWRRHQPNSTSFNNTVLGGDSSLGNFGFRPDNNFSDSLDFVPEPLMQTGNQALNREGSVIRNGPMRTIGELGLIYDPAVHTTGYSSSSGGALTRERGGFRTLAIGSDVGEARGPNRLAHTMPSTGNSTISQRRAYRLLDIFTANNSETGKILVNSSLRNPQNFPLRALFHNLQFQNNTTSNSTSELAAPFDGVLGAAGRTINVDELLSDWSSFERSRGPFLSVGQIADLETFTNSDLGVNLSPNAANTNALDRGREELLRNTFGLLTLKGSVYKIYTIGQAGSVNSSGVFQPKSTALIERTVKLERVYPQNNGLQSIRVDNLLTNNTATTINVETISTKYH